MVVDDRRPISLLTEPAAMDASSPQPSPLAQG
jgi:hypothetical protein